MEQRVTARRLQLGVFNWLVPPEALSGDRVQQEPQTGRCGPRLCAGYSVARLSGSQSHPSPWDRGFFRPTFLHSPHKVLNTLPSSPIQHPPHPPAPTVCPPWPQPLPGGTQRLVLVLALRVRDIRWAVGQEGQESRSLAVEPQTGSRRSAVYPGEPGVWAQPSDLPLNPTS